MEVPEVEDVAEIASTHLDVLYAKITTTKWNSKFIAAKKKKSRQITQIIILHGIFLGPSIQSHEKTE